MYKKASLFFKSVLFPRLGHRVEGFSLQTVGFKCEGEVYTPRGGGEVVVVVAAAAAAAAAEVVVVVVVMVLVAAQQQQG